MRLRSCEAPNGSSVPAFEQRGASLHVWSIRYRADARGARRLAARVRADIVLDMLATYVQWHSRKP